MTVRLAAQTKVANEYCAIMQIVTAEAIKDAKAMVTNTTDIDERREQLIAVCQRALLNFQTRMQAVINQYTPIQGSGNMQECTPTPQVHTA